jgi:hypothetical protein
LAQDILTVTLESTCLRAPIATRAKMGDSRFHEDTSMLSAHERNEIHKAFWVIETAEAENRMMCKVTMEIVTNITRSQRHMPPAYVSTFESTLINAEELKLKLTPLFIAHATSRAGSAPRELDSLTAFIRNALKANPELTQNDLLHALKKAAKDGGPTVDHDGKRITFTTARGQSKDVSINVLKDRLSRAKKQMRSSN